MYSSPARLFVTHLTKRTIYLVNWKGLCNPGAVLPITDPKMIWEGGDWSRPHGNVHAGSYTPQHTGSFNPPQSGYGPEPPMLLLSCAGMTSGPEATGAKGMCDEAATRALSAYQVREAAMGKYLCDQPVWPPGSGSRGLLHYWDAKLTEFKKKSLIPELTPIPTIASLCNKESRAYTTNQQNRTSCCASHHCATCTEPNLPTYLEARNMHKARHSITHDVPLRSRPFSSHHASRFLCRRSPTLQLASGNSNVCPVIFSNRKMYLLDSSETSSSGASGSVSSAYGSQFSQNHSLRNSLSMFCGSCSHNSIP